MSSLSDTSAQSWNWPTTRGAADHDETAASAYRLACATAAGIEADAESGERSELLAAAGTAGAFGGDGVSLAAVEYVNAHSDKLTAAPWTQQQIGEMAFDGLPLVLGLGLLSDGELTVRAMADGADAWTAARCAALLADRSSEQLRRP